MWQIFRKLFSGEQKKLRTLHFCILSLLVIVILLIYYSSLLGDYQGFSLLWYLTIAEYSTRAYGFLFLIPLTYAAFFLNSQILLFTWIFCGLLMYPRVAYLSLHFDSLLIAYLIYCVPFFIAIFIKTVNMWKQMERKAAAEKEEQRQKYLLQVYKAQENERKNIAMELHDSVIQSLIVMTNHAQSIISNKKYAVPDPDKDEFKDMVAQIVALRDSSREISRDIRNICLDLRPYMIDDMGLIPALRWLIDRTKTATSITLSIEGEERRYDSESELMIYRIIQEAISNINRHSQASEARIHFCFHPEGLRITIQDNGKGFVFPEKMGVLTEQGKMGLIGMQERVKLLNGNMKITSQPGQGTLITIESAIKG